MNKTKGQILGEQYSGAMISDDFVQYGLTKREYFAGLALQGLLSNSEIRINKLNEIGVNPYEKLTEDALEYVDVLLEKLAE